MLTVEECLKGLDKLVNHPVKDRAGNVYKISNTWDARFVNDVATHYRNGKAISTAQGEIAVKLIQRYRDHLIELGFHEQNVDALIALPIYEREPYQSTFLPREVRYAGDSKLVFRCKFNANVVEDIKRLKGVNHFLSHPHPLWLAEHKLWVVDVNSANRERVIDVISRHNFQFDDTVAQFLMEATNAVSESSSVAMEGDQIKVVVRNDDFLAAWVNAVRVMEG